MRDSMSTPTAASAVPPTIGHRGPIRWASAPAWDESASISSVTGSSAAPAATGENPATTCSCRVRKKNTPPSAAYTASVTTLTALNWREANTVSGSIGLARRRSTRRTPPPDAIPDGAPATAPRARPRRSART